MNFRERVFKRISNLCMPVINPCPNNDKKFVLYTLLPDNQFFNLAGISSLNYNYVNTIT